MPRERLSDERITGEYFLCFGTDLLQFLGRGSSNSELLVEFPQNHARVEASNSMRIQRCLMRHAVPQFEKELLVCSERSTRQLACEQMHLSSGLRKAGPYGIMSPYSGVKGDGKFRKELWRLRPRTKHSL